jgi:NADH:ubiquinone oxidoreductase subunit 6 (subunit J)
MLEPFVFAALAAVVIAGGLAVVLFGRITASALSMALSFLGMAGLFVLLGAETIALFQVLIYVGAITVLILYGVMLTQASPRPYALFFQRQAGWALIPLSLIAIVTVWLAFRLPPGSAHAERGNDLEPLAVALFNDYAFTFEVASVLLLAAMIGAIALVRRGED